MAQLKAVMPEGNADLAAIETALQQPEMKKLAKNDQKRLKAYIASLELKRSVISIEISKSKIPRCINIPQNFCILINTIHQPNSILSCSLVAPDQICIR